MLSTVSLYKERNGDDKDKVQSTVERSVKLRSCASPVDLATFLIHSVGAGAKASETAKTPCLLLLSSQNLVRIMTK